MLKPGESKKFSDEGEIDQSLNPEPGETKLQLLSFPPKPMTEEMKSSREKPATTNNQKMENEPSEKINPSKEGLPIFVRNLQKAEFKWLPGSAPTTTVNPFTFYVE